MNNAEVTWKIDLEVDHMNPYNEPRVLSRTHDKQGRQSPSDGETRHGSHTINHDQFVSTP